MNSLAKTILLCSPLLLSGWQNCLGEQPKTAPVRTGPTKSVFTIPTSPKEGRDPFFPESTRVYEVQVTTIITHAPEITSLKIKGYSVVNGEAMVIINNHTFTTNDEGDVLVPGGRVHIHCIDIKPSVVIVEANGQRMDLHF